MKHLRPTSEFHRMMWLINQKRKQKNLSMITVEQALLFAEWANARYLRVDGVWVSKGPHPTGQWTTRELWELYQRFLGNKSQTDKK